jgi:protein-disulfide isomerase
LLKQYPNQIKVVFKHFPLRNHRFALPAAMATMAAHEQGKFWPYHDKVFAKYQGLNEEFFTMVAEELELDMEQFKRSLGDKRLRAQVQADAALGREIGVRGTPTIFINGRLVQQKNLQGFKLAIDNLLKKGN